MLCHYVQTSVLLHCATVCHIKVTWGESKCPCFCLSLNLLTFFRWMLVHNWRGNTYSRNIIEVFLNWNCSYFPKFEISAPSSFLHFNENVMFGCAQTCYVYGKCKAIANSRPGDPPKGQETQQTHKCFKYNSLVWKSNLKIWKKNKCIDVIFFSQLKKWVLNAIVFPNYRKWNSKYFRLKQKKRRQL